jgi:two-component system chemotaxis sensor kinase CheA
MSEEAIAVFQIEARENLELIEQGLLDLLERPEDRDLVDAVFRGLHTLKGSGSMFGFDALAGFTHHCETAFDRVRKGEVAATTDLVSAVLAARDHMRCLMEDPSGDHGAAGDVLLADLERAVREADGAACAVPAVVMQTWRIRFDLPANAFKNGTNPQALLAEIRDLGEALVIADTSRVPPLAQIDPTDHYLAWDVTLHSDQGRSAIEDVFIFVMDDMNLSIEALDETAAPETVVDATPVLPAEAAPVPVAPVQPAQTVANDPIDSSAAKTGQGRRERAGSGRTPRRTDGSRRRTGHRPVAPEPDRHSASSDTALRSVSEEIERLSGELRDTMMVLRMVPVATCFPASAVWSTIWPARRARSSSCRPTANAPRSTRPSSNGWPIHWSTSSATRPTTGWNRPGIASPPASRRPAAFACRRISRAARWSSPSATTAAVSIANGFAPRRRPRV